MTYSILYSSVPKSLRFKCCLNIHLLMHFCTNEEEFYFVTVHLLSSRSLAFDAYNYYKARYHYVILKWSFFLRRLIDCFGFYSAFHHKMRQHLPGIHMWPFFEILKSPWQPWRTYSMTNTREMIKPREQYIDNIYLSNGLFFFERCSLITATVCAYKLNNAR